MAKTGHRSNSTLTSPFATNATFAPFCSFALHHTILDKPVCRNRNLPRITNQQQQHCVRHSRFINKIFREIRTQTINWLPIEAPFIFHETCWWDLMVLFLAGWWMASGGKVTVKHRPAFQAISVYAIDGIRISWLDGFLRGKCVCLEKSALKLYWYVARHQFPLYTKAHHKNKWLCVCLNTKWMPLAPSNATNEETK